jgi:hypothetical protein
MEGTLGSPRLRLTMLLALRSSSVRVPSSRRGTALSIATTEPLHRQPRTHYHTGVTASTRGFYKESSVHHPMVPEIKHAADPNR